MKIQQSEQPSNKRFFDFSNHRFGRLVIKSFAGHYDAACGKRRHFWHAACDCGSQITVAHNELRRGETTSCGCFQIEATRNRSIKHLSCNTPEYRSWAAMKQRCLDQKHVAYENYGGRGILICERWIGSFENFLSDMGARPVGTTLDRIENNEGYRPDNCRWATQSQQRKNQRKRERKPDGTFAGATAQ